MTKEEAIKRYQACIDKVDNERYARNEEEEHAYRTWDGPLLTVPKDVARAHRAVAMALTEMYDAERYLEARGWL